MASEAFECGHDGCTCLVTEEGGYCSDHCREHAEDAAHETGHGCECGHAECQGTAA